MNLAVRLDLQSSRYEYKDLQSDRTDAEKKMSKDGKIVKWIEFLQN